MPAGALLGPRRRATRCTQSPKMAQIPTSRNVGDLPIGSELPELRGWPTSWTPRSPASTCWRGGRRCAARRAATYTAATELPWMRLRRGGSRWTSTRAPTWRTCASPGCGSSLLDDVTRVRLWAKDDCPAASSAPTGDTTGHWAWAAAREIHGAATAVCGLARRPGGAAPAGDPGQLPVVPRWLSSPTVLRLIKGKRLLPKIDKRPAAGAWAPPRPRPPRLLPPAARRRPWRARPPWPLQAAAGPRLAGQRVRRQQQLREASTAVARHRDLGQARHGTALGPPPVDPQPRVCGRSSRWSTCGPAVPALGGVGPRPRAATPSRITSATLPGRGSGTTCLGARRAVDDDRAARGPGPATRAPAPPTATRPAHAERDQVLHEDRGERGADAGLRRGQPLPSSRSRRRAAAPALQLEGADLPGTTGGEEALDDLGEEARRETASWWTTQAHHGGMYFMPLWDGTYSPSTTRSGNSFLRLALEARPSSSRSRRPQVGATKSWENRAGRSSCSLPVRGRT